MDPVRKALWFVESHSGDRLSLEEIARACHVSAYHLTRAFAATTGLSLMRYVRARRLTGAARQLAAGATDILRVALDSGYGSHEAFSRAFKEQFSLTPEQVRAQGGLDTLTLMEPITMETTTLPELAPPRFETKPAMTLAGLVERYNCQSPAGIPAQWQRFGPYIGRIPSQTGRSAYGACYNFDEDINFDYMSGVEVQGGAGATLPEGLVRLDLPEQKYVIFRHAGHIAGIRGTLAAIWSKWFPESGCEPAKKPTLEHYGPEFSATTGLGGVEIWIAIL